MAIGAKELMAENRAAQIIANIEPSLNTLVNTVLDSTGMSGSTYLRKLIITDLMERGLLTQEKLLTIVG